MSQLAIPLAERFDKIEAAERKKAGQDRAAARRAIVLNEARKGARVAAKSNPDRIATADDAYRWLVARGYDPAELGNAAGAIFKGDHWRHSGYVKSERASNNARVISAWRLT